MELKIVSFNIRCADDADGHSIAERAPRLAAVTLPLDADVIGFQEYTPKWKEHIEKYFGAEYEIFNKYRREDKPESTPILWKKDKFKVLNKGYFWLSDTPEVESRGWDRIGCYRICEYVTLEDVNGGGAFTFMNTHFGFGDECQISSADLIYKYSKKISNLPTFVTGDFNMTPTTAGYREMTKYFTDAGAATAKDTSATFHGYYQKGTPCHIDYCFTDKTVKPMSWSLIDGKIDGKFPSDHYGIEIQMDI